ncbi:MAG: hypothetical protein IKX59_07450 [Bacteroidales bacterium]|nr:hypothetical protein [Bacteroidales bacterium]
MAHIKWGGSWVMPTDKQVDELYKKCHWNWISQNGVYGCLVTGPNGGSIFLPAAGYCQYDRICDAGSLGSYWSSSSVHDKLVAYGFSFNSDYWSAGYFSIQRGGLSVGNSVRAVHMPVAQAIDLGLPSGTKWASWNVGAFSPEEPGGYFAWGETEIKNDYSSETYYNNGYFNPNDDIGATDYDVAHVMWGGSWRMPSVDQVKELFDNCSWSWTTQGRVNGILVIGRNGNTIFLPSIGYYVRDDLYGGSYYGSYWLSSRIWSLPQYLDFDLYLNPDCRDGRTPYCGLTVRAVCQ